MSWLRSVLRVGAALLGGAAALSCGGPVACGDPVGPFPGGALSGPVHEGPLPDWTFVADVETIQLESRPADPHSVTTWVGAVDGSLYVATSLILGAEDPMDRDWVRHVLEDPRVRLRIDGTIYPLRAERVEDRETARRVREALIAKYDVERDARSEGAWIFRMEAR